MRILALAVLLGTLSMTGCGPRAPSVDSSVSGGTGLGALPTSPAGVGSLAGGGLPARVIDVARGFRGNPMPLAVLTGGVLVAALGLGLYTIRLAYRQPPGDNAP
jgi:hypothetical protein